LLHDPDGAASAISHYSHPLTQFTDIDGHFPVFPMPEASTTSPHADDPNNDAHQSRESLLTINSTLKTRISELELINDLFRGRLADLERDQAHVRDSDTQLRNQLEAARDLEAQLRSELSESHLREISLKRQVEEILGSQDPSIDLARHQRPDGSTDTKSPPSKRQKPDTESATLPVEKETVVDPSMQATIDESHMAEESMAAEHGTDAAEA